MGGTPGSLMTLLGQIRRAIIMEKVPDKPGRPNVRRVLDHPDDPLLDELIQALGMSP